MSDKLGVVALLAGVAVNGFLLVATRPDRRAAQPALILLGTLALFALGELLLLWRQVVPGALFFVAGALLFVLARSWSSANAEVTPSNRYHRCFMIATVLAVLGVGIGLRFWHLGDIPYGIEQDELAWTVGAAHATYSDLYVEFEVQTVGFQENLLPTSSFQERAFFDVFGMSMDTARLENAVFSTAAVGLFFVLVSLMASRTVAICATFFLSISTLHIASARQAHVEAHVLFWVMLSYLLFWLAVRTRSAVLSLATGISVIIGMWTYETYNMTVAVIAVSFVLFALVDIRHWRSHLVHMGLFLLPIGFIAQEQIEHAQSRRSFHMERFDAFRASLDGPFWQQGWDWVTYFGENLGTLFENLFIRQTHPAAEFPMVRPDGPMVLAATLPLAVLGLLVALRAPTRRAHIFLFLWIAFQLLAVPTVLGIGWGRVILPATPALFVLAGIGGAFVLQHLLPASGRRAWIIVGSTLLLAGVLVTTSARAYFYEVEDPLDRQIRREVVDVVASQRDEASYILIPITDAPETRDDRLVRPSLAEMRFLLGRPPDLATAEVRFQQVLFMGLLEEVSRPGRDPEVTDSIAILLPHRNRDPRVPLEPGLDAVDNCYDLTVTYEGRFVDMLEITKESLAKPHCPA